MGRSSTAHRRHGKAHAAAFGGLFCQPGDSVQSGNCPVCAGVRSTHGISVAHRARRIRRVGSVRVCRVRAIHRPRRIRRANSVPVDGTPMVVRAGRGRRARGCTRIVIVLDGVRGGAAPFAETSLRLRLPVGRSRRDPCPRTRSSGRRRSSVRRLTARTSPGDRRLARQEARRLLDRSASDRAIRGRNSRDAPTIGSERQAACL